MVMGGPEGLVRGSMREVVGGPEIPGERSWEVLKVWWRGSVRGLIRGHGRT